MLNFILGAFIGANIGFMLFAVISINERDNWKDEQ